MIDIFVCEGYVMNRKMFLLMFVLIIGLFGFCNRVDAKQIMDFKDYYFYTSKESGGDTIIHGEGGYYGSLEVGGGYLYFDNDEKAYFEVYDDSGSSWYIGNYMSQSDLDKLLEDGILDGNGIDWDDVPDDIKKRAIFSYLSSRFQGTANGGGSSNNVFGYLKSTYCTKSPGNNTKLCKEYVGVSSKSSYSSGGRNMCTYGVQSGFINKDSNRISQTFTVSFADNNDSLSDPKVFQGNRTDLEVQGDYLTLNGEKGSYKIFLHEYGETKEKFLSDILSQIKKDSNGQYNCGDNLVSMCLSKDNSTDFYLLVNKKECDSSKYADWYRQELGNDTDGTIINTVEESLYAKGLLGGKTEDVDCKELFKGPLLTTVRLIINAVKILVPLILLGLGSLDFAKAIFAQDEGAIKKSQGKFIKRVIIAIVIFLIPTLLGVILDIGNSIWPDYIDNSLCGIRENVSSASSTSGKASEASSSQSSSSSGTDKKSTS